MASTEEVAALMKALEGLTAQLKKQEATIAEQGSMIADQAEQLRRAPTTAPTVNVKVSPPPLRLSTFTGLAPKGGQEVTFKEWKDKVKAAAIESPEEGDLFPRIKASLKGLALNQAMKCKNSKEIIDVMTSIYGDVKTCEDKYRDFLQLKPMKGETAGDFFNRLWDKFVCLNEENEYDEDETKRKIYHTFSVNVKDSHPLLSLELRNKFGTPGSAKPEMMDVLRTVRELDGSDSTTVHASQVSAAPVIDYDALAEAVVKKMNLPKSQFQPGQPSRSLKGPCYRCGLVGDHYKRDCPNPANPQLVRDEKRRMSLNGR